jgi:alkanesulfonate monooxygenase SsuD/methylene tetrahydromethanopterin reductase-like flavin-dependent oxidoreductase (luciferase family)
VAPPLLVGGIRPRTVSLAGELADGVIIPGGVSPEEVRASAGHLHSQRGAGRGPADVVVFISAPAAGPAEAIAATVREYAAAAATCVAVNTDEEDADLERFVGFLAQKVSPLL